MSKADEIIKNLGYTLIKNDDEEIKYIDEGNEDLYISFYKKYKVITGMPTYDYFLDMPLLQAINLKCKELRLDWRRR